MLSTSCSRQVAVPERLALSEVERSRRAVQVPNAQCPMPFYEQTVNIELKNSKLTLIINSLGVKQIADSLLLDIR
ncbi:MAG: hypothetical protein V7L20_21320 [Nostoc sp.]